MLLVVLLPFPLLRLLNVQGSQSFQLSNALRAVTCYPVAATVRLSLGLGARVGVGEKKENNTKHTKCEGSRI